MPILECGGKVLTAGEQIVVRSDLAARLEKKYAPYLTKVGETIVTALRHGYFEFSRGLEDATVKSTTGDEPLEAISSDRSMAKAGKVKTRRKAK